jgi:hypothetical protein
MEYMFQTFATILTDWRMRNEGTISSPPQIHIRMILKLVELKRAFHDIFTAPLGEKETREAQIQRFPQNPREQCSGTLGNKKQCDEWCVAGHAGFRTGGVQDAFRSQIWMGQKVHCTLSSERPMSFAG